MKLLDELVSEGRCSSSPRMRPPASARAVGSCHRQSPRSIGSATDLHRVAFAVATTQSGNLARVAWHDGRCGRMYFLSVAAGSVVVRHRVGYRTALDRSSICSRASHHAPSRSRSPNQPRDQKLSPGGGLTVVQEPETALEVGATQHDGVFISDLERSLLDARCAPRARGWHRRSCAGAGCRIFQRRRRGRSSRSHARAILSWRACVSPDRFPGRYVGRCWLGPPSRTADQTDQRHRSRAWRSCVFLP